MGRVHQMALLLAAVSTSAAAAVSVETASGDWSNLPQLSQRGSNHLNEKMQARLFEIAESKQCPSFQLKGDRLDLQVSFAAQYARDGSLSRLVMPKIECAEAESIIGGALLEMTQGGDYAPSGNSPAGWYQGALTFSFAGKSAVNPAVPKSNQGQVMNVADAQSQIQCERVEEIGTRLGATRVCMTRAQWAERRKRDRDEVERVQMQRGCKDIQGCGG
jgi:hypothetical protein